jgi:hypothetical protein
VKITEGTKIVFSYGLCLDYMIELSEDLLNDRKSSELMIEFVDSIRDLNLWLSNGLRIWESIVQKIGGTVREVLFETRRKIKVDIFESQFTEFVRYFNITIGESIL